MPLIKVAGVPEHFNTPWQLAIDKGIFEKHGIEVEKAFPLFIFLLSPSSSHFLPLFFIIYSYFRRVLNFN